MRVSFLATPASILTLWIPVTLVALMGAGCGATADVRSSTLVAPLKVPELVCTRYASPRGTATGTGTREQPYPSAQQLADSLKPGETGCLLPGTYREAVNVRQGGTAAL